MEIEFSRLALQDIEEWKKSGDKKSMQKISSILKSIKADYKSGIGKPESLRGSLSGCWSRRIDKKNRLIYQVYEDENIITIISLKGHYSDK